MSVASTSETEEATEERGLGGALLREKAVEERARHFIVIIDGSKLVSLLGTKAPLPVEVAQADWEAAADKLAALGCLPVLRRGPSEPFITDNGNYLLDCRFPAGIADAPALAAALDRDPLVIGHGLFLRMADEVIIGGPTGTRRLLRP